jgi:subtilisin
VAASLVAGPAARGASPSDRHIVVLRHGVDPGAAGSAHAARHGVRVERVYRSALHGYAARIPPGRVDEVRSDPDVVSVTPDRAVRAAAEQTPTGVSRIRTALTTNRGRRVHVAVLDTGIDLGHPELVSAVAGAKDCSGPDTGTVADGNGHGTHVAGTIAARANGEGVRGVAPLARLWVVKVLDDRGQGSEADVLCGLDFVDARSPARGGPIRVANMSLEFVGSTGEADDGNCGLTDADPLHQAVCRVVADGVAVVAAAGNGAEDIRLVPLAAYDEVLTVTALGDSDGAPCGLGPPTAEADDDGFARYSGFATTDADRAHTLAAPGEAILSTLPGGAFDSLSGTSMAAAHASGLAALYLESFPGSSPAAIRDALRSMGEPPDVSWNGECATGASHRDDLGPGQPHPEPLAAAWALPRPPQPRFTLGVVRGNVWYLASALGPAADRTFVFGRATDRPVVGDWDGDGVFTPGVVRGNEWFLSNDLDGVGEIVFRFGRATDRPVVGDWDGDGTWTPGVVRGNQWFLSNGFDPVGEIAFGYGRSTDVPLPGDWDGDGVFTPGVVRGNQWFLSNGFDPVGEIAFAFGRPTDAPIAGDWDGDGVVTPGVVRGNLWYLNAGFDPVAETVVGYGRSTDRKLTGDWNGLAR